MQVPNEVVSVAFIEGHKSTTHDDELDLIRIVTKTLQLLHSVFGLQVGVVPSSDGSHRRWLVAGITLRAVLEVTIGTTGAVDADVARHGDMRASMWLRHDCNDCNTTCCSHRLAL